jgi:hypothetical protein
MGGYWRPKWGLGMKVEAKAEVGAGAKAPEKSGKIYISDGFGLIFGFASPNMGGYRE